MEIDKEESTAEIEKTSETCAATRDADSYLAHSGAGTAFRARPDRLNGQGCDKRNDFYSTYSSFIDANAPNSGG